MAENHRNGPNTEPAPLLGRQHAERPGSGIAAASVQRPLADTAARALAEAKTRRAEGRYDRKLPPEQGGRDGPEPIRYGDWEKNGIASDF